MEEFTVEEVIGFQIEIIRASGIEEDQGLEGRLLNPGNLDFVIAVGNRIPDPFERAAFMLHGIATGHPFVQGNKRIAFLLAALILKRTPERYIIASSDAENNAFVRDVAGGKKTRKDVLNWLHAVVKTRSMNYSARRSSVFLCRSMSILKSSCTEGRGSSGRGILGGPAEHGAVESRGRLYEDPGSATFSPLPVL